MSECIFRVNCEGKCALYFLPLTTGWEEMVVVSRFTFPSLNLPSYQNREWECYIPPRGCLIMGHLISYCQHFLIMYGGNVRLKKYKASTFQLTILSLLLKITKLSHHSFQSTPLSLLVSNFVFLSLGSTDIQSPLSCRDQRFHLSFALCSISFLVWSCLPLAWPVACSAEWLNSALWRCLAQLVVSVTNCGSALISHFAQHPLTLQSMICPSLVIFPFTVEPTLSLSEDK